MHLSYHVINSHVINNHIRLELHSSVVHDAITHANEHNAGPEREVVRQAWVVCICVCTQNYAIGGTSYYMRDLLDSQHPGAAIVSGI